MAFFFYESIIDEPLQPHDLISYGASFSWQPSSNLHATIIQHSNSPKWQCIEVQTPIGDAIPEKPIEPANQNEVPAIHPDGCD